MTKYVGAFSERPRTSERYRVFLYEIYSQILRVTDGVDFRLSSESIRIGYWNNNLRPKANYRFIQNDKFFIFKTESCFQIYPMSDSRQN